MLVHIVNFYLEEENKAYRRRLTEIALSNSPSAFEILALYAREALRLDPVTVGIMREVESSMVVSSVSEPVDLYAGDKVFLSLKKANLDEVCEYLSFMESLALNKWPIQPGSRAARIHPAIESSHNYEVFLGDGIVRLLGENFVFTVGITREVGSPMCVPGVSESVDLHVGEKVFLSLKKANLDEVCTCLSIIES